MPGWWYTQVSKKTLSISSSSGAHPALASAMPLNRPQWYGTAPPPWGMIHRIVGKSRNSPEVMAWVNAVVSAPR